MDWVKFKLPIPVYQQEQNEKCSVFLRRIQYSLEPSSRMAKEDAVFWFLMGMREEIVNKIPFDPSKSMWIDPDELEELVIKIDEGVALTGPFRLNRFQNCFNYFICFNCGQWGHKSVICRNEKSPLAINKAAKRKISEAFCFDEPQKKAKPVVDNRNNSGDFRTSPNTRDAQHSDLNFDHAFNSNNNSGSFQW